MSDLNKLTNWPNKVKTMQSNWIGKSIGAEIDFKVLNHKTTITVFTTRPDTIFGATFLAVSIEHDLSEKILKQNKNLAKFIKECGNLNPDKVKGFETDCL